MEKVNNNFTNARRNRFSSSTFCTTVDEECEQTKKYAQREEQKNVLNKRVTFCWTRFTVNTTKRMLELLLASTAEPASLAHGRPLAIFRQRRSVAPLSKTVLRVTALDL